MPFHKFFLFQNVEKSKLFASLPFGILNILMLNLTIIYLFPKTIALLIVLRVNNDHYFFTKFLVIFVRSFIHMLKLNMIFGSLSIFCVICNDFEAKVNKSLFRN